MSAIRRLLVANRGEIACRVFRTCARLGIESVAVYSEADRDALHARVADLAVPLGGLTSTESYLDIGKVLAAARASGADAVHPGYGFLAENADFARAVVEAGLSWVGPAAESIRLMGSKVEAKRLAVVAGLPVAPSAELLGDDPAAWAAAVHPVGFPLLVKASAGGGGKGMRLVEAAGDLAGAVESCRREAGSSFGDPAVFAERYVVGARHVEVQVFGDLQGHLVHLYERECSVQRRHQKVVEESPSPGLEAATRERMFAAALALAKAVGYVGAGTVEFLVEGTGDEQDFVFLEMNTRLQVEHPVTEAVTGLDLVEWQLDVAAGRDLPLGQHEITTTGHAIEARVCAEDPAHDHRPSAGRVLGYVEPLAAGVRVDSSLEAGSVVPPYYDPLLAKVIGAAGSREQAAQRLARGLRGLRIDGLVTNRDQLVAVLEHGSFLAGDTRTTFLDEHPEVSTSEPPGRVQEVHLAAAALAQQELARASAPVQRFAPSGFRNVRAVRETRRFSRLPATDAAAVEVTYAFGRDGLELAVAGADVVGLDYGGSEHLDGGCGIVLTVDGVRANYTVVSYPAGSDSAGLVVVTDSRWTTTWTALPRFATAVSSALAGGPSTSLPGTVTQVVVQAGDAVTAGQTLVVLEAMKMEHRIVADRDGIVADVLVAAGDSVEAHQLVARLVDGAEDG